MVLVYCNSNSKESCELRNTATFQKNQVFSMVLYLDFEGSMLQNVSYTGSLRFHCFWRSQIWHFCAFFLLFFFNQIKPIFWNRVQNIICCAHKKKFRVKTSKTSYLVLVCSFVWMAKWSDSAIPPWETFLVGICLDFEYNETGNHWFFWTFAVLGRA